MYEGSFKKYLSFYATKHFVLFFRNISFCGLYMVSDEFDRRKLIEEESCLQLKNTIHEPVELKATENKPVHHILWQRLINIFNIDSYSNIHSLFHNKDKQAT